MRGFYRQCDLLQEMRAAGNPNVPSCTPPGSSKFPLDTLFAVIGESGARSISKDVFVDISREILSARLSSALGKTRQAAQAHYDREKFPPDLEILGKIQQYAQSGWFMEGPDTAALIGTTSLAEGATTWEHAQCVAYSRNIDTLRGLLQGTGFTKLEAYYRRQHIVDGLADLLLARKLRFTS